MQHRCATVKRHLSILPSAHSPVTLARARSLRGMQRPTVPASLTGAILVPPEHVRMLTGRSVWGVDLRPLQEDEEDDGPSVRAEGLGLEPFDVTLALFPASVWDWFDIVLSGDVSDVEDTVLYAKAVTLWGDAMEYPAGSPDRAEAMSLGAWCSVDFR